MNETLYQRRLISKLHSIIPDCFIIKNDPSLNQGMPDLLILVGNQWAMLEVKPFSKAPIQPNQEYYIEFFNEMAFASFIWPEIEEQVLHDLQSALGVHR